MRIYTAFLIAVALTLLTASAHAQDSDDMWRIAIHHAFDIPNKLPALDPHLYSTFSPTPGVLADRVTYATADGMLVPAIIYRPDPKLIPAHTRLPGIIVVNGHGGDKFSWYAFYSGILLAKAGAVVLTYDPIGKGERNAHRLSRQTPSPHDAPVSDQTARHLAGLMQADLMQAVAYLDAQPSVDPTRIGVVAYSMGAFIAGITGAIDSRIHAILLSGGGTYDDAPGGYFDANKLPCQGPPYRALLPDLGSARGFDIFYLNAERGPMLIMNGAADTVMDIPHHNTVWFDAMRSRLTTQCGPQNRIRCDNVFTHIEYPGISHRTSWVTTDGVEWLNRQIHFAFWSTDAIILAQGATHISTWIKANNVDISPNYLREDREGGLDAVGTNIPALSRASLMVLPDPDWQRLQPQLTYESWAAKTLAAEQALTGPLPKPSTAPVH